MKKRLLSLLLPVAILTMAITSGVYAKDNKTMDLFTEFNQSLKNFDSISMYMHMTMDMDVAGEGFTMEMEGTVSEVIRSETDIDMEIDLTTDIPGMEIPMKMFYKDGVYYQNAMDQKVKTVMPIEDVMSQLNLDAFNMSVPESAIKEQSTQETDEGTELTFILEGSELNALLGAPLGSLSTLLGEIPDLYFSDIEITALIGEDNVMKAMEMSFDMEMTMQDETAIVSYLIYIEIIQIGGITIEFPDDLDTYTEQELTAE